MVKFLAGSDHTHDGGDRGTRRLANFKFCGVTVSNSAWKVLRYAPILY